MSAVVVPLFRLEDRQHRRERDGIQVVDRSAATGMLSMPTSTLSEVKLRSNWSIDAHEPVEHDLQHRQAFV